MRVDGDAPVSVGFVMPKEDTSKIIIYQVHVRHKSFLHILAGVDILCVVCRTNIHVIHVYTDMVCLCVVCPTKIHVIYTDMVCRYYASGSYGLFLHKNSVSDKSPFVSYIQFQNVKGPFHFRRAILILNEKTRGFLYFSRLV